MTEQKNSKKSNNRAPASYWKDINEIYSDGIIHIITGKFRGEGRKLACNLYGKFPNSRGKLTPLYFSEKIGKILLAGLLQDALLNGDKDLIKNIKEAMEYLGYI